MEWNGGQPAGDGVYRENVNKIVKARITGLTPMGTGAAGLTEGQDLYLVEYRLLPEDQENIVLSPGMRTEILDGETWITEWGEEGQPYLLLDWKYREDMPLRRQPVWSLLGVTNTLEIFGVPDVSAFAEELAENYVSISLERYMAAHQPPFAAPSPEPTALPETLTGYSEYGSMTFRLDLDGWHEDFSYTVIWREGTAEPVLSPNRQLTRVGSTNRFILEYGVSLYLLDFDTGELRAFLPYEADGLRYADLEEQNKNQDNKARWASCPQVSPDGSLLLYQTDRAPGGIRAYDFAAGLDRWLARGFATAGGVAWTERDSVILRNYDHQEGYSLYEVSLADGSAVRLCGLGSPAWDGAWPWVYGASEHSFLSLNLETGEIIATALEGEVTRLRANPAWPALALLEWVSGENQYRLLLYAPGTREAQEVFRIADSASFREFRWTGENTLLLSEYAQGITGTGSLLSRTETVSLGDRLVECTARVDRTRLLSPAPEPTALPDAPVTVSCGGAAVIPYIAMRWAETWTGDGFLAGDGMAPDFVIREHAAEIPVLRRDGSVSLTYGAGAAPAGTVLRIYTADLELWKACGEEPEAELEALPPGTWWCSLGVVRTGRYIPEAERSESFGDDAIFCLEVPAEARQWKEELGSPGSFAVRASGSLEEIGARWAEAYAARYTGLSAENPLCCSEAAVRYCTLAAESLLPDPKEAYFRICLFLNARAPRDFASLCSPGDTPPDVDVFWPLEDSGYEGWLRMDFYVRLQNEGEDMWRSVELGVGGVSEWGWLDWTAPAGDVKYCMSCLLEGTVRMPEMVLRMLPHVDWSSFGDTYGSEGWEALRPVLLQGCRSTGFSNDPEDQSYRDTYVMLAALNAEGTAFFPELCEILRLQESADPERFARCLSLLGERGGRLLSGMEAAEHADSGLALLREVSGYALKDWDRAVERGEFTALCEGIGLAALGDRQAQRDAYVMAAALRADGAYAEFLSTILQAQREADADAWGEALAAFSREEAELLRKLAELPGEGGE